MKKLFLFLSSALLLTACANSVPQASTLVYINAGYIQCESDGKTGAEIALLLTAKNIAVTDIQCGHLSNVAVIAMCGATAIKINVHRIVTADLVDAQALGFVDVMILKQQDSAGYDSGEC